MFTLETYHPVASNTSSGMSTFSWSFFKVFKLLFCLFIRAEGCEKTEDVGDEISDLADAYELLTLKFTTDFFLTNLFKKFDIPIGKRVKSSSFVATDSSDVGP